MGIENQKATSDARAEFKPNLPSEVASLWPTVFSEDVTKGYEYARRLADERKVDPYALEQIDGRVAEKIREAADEIEQVVNDLKELNLSDEDVAIVLEPKNSLLTSNFGEETPLGRVFDSLNKTDQDRFPSIRTRITNARYKLESECHRQGAALSLLMADASGQ
jgi:hypothetical protein